MKKTMKMQLAEAIGVLALAGSVWILGNYLIYGLRPLKPTGRIVTVILPSPNRVDAAERRWMDRTLGILLRRLDSLRRDSAGRSVYDSLLRMRPGLMDSLRAVYAAPVFLENFK
jgi:hypothetical protein